MPTGSRLVTAFGAYTPAAGTASRASSRHRMVPSAPKSPAAAHLAIGARSRAATCWRTSHGISRGRTKKKARFQCWSGLRMSGAAPSRPCRCRYSRWKLAPRRRSRRRACRSALSGAGSDVPWRAGCRAWPSGYGVMVNPSRDLPTRELRSPSDWPPSPAQSEPSGKTSGYWQDVAESASKTLEQAQERSQTRRIGPTPVG